jgi:hypothetical protein
MPPPSIPSTAVRSQCLITNSNSACQLNEPYYKHWPSLPFALLSTQTTVVSSPHTNECQWMSGVDPTKYKWSSHKRCGRDKAKVEYNRHRCQMIIFCSFIRFWKFLNFKFVLDDMFTMQSILVSRVGDHRKGHLGAKTSNQLHLSVQLNRMKETYN